MATESELYRGFHMDWQHPPLTTIGYEINIAPTNTNDMELLKRVQGGASGALVMNAERDKEKALAAARRKIDAIRS